LLLRLVEVLQWLLLVVVQQRANLLQEHSNGGLWGL
jgi:hypothetical protein